MANDGCDLIGAGYICLGSTVPGGAGRETERGDVGGLGSGGGLVQPTPKPDTLARKSLRSESL